mmetsp:Transcript_20969/g.33476  ORF Transcript_20969/g.33476 Transcript_20969/m.33476 type:complete len:263 (-) Transcript_20969:765-1553(-)
MSGTLSVTPATVLLLPSSSLQAIFSDSVMADPMHAEKMSPRTSRVASLAARCFFASFTFGLSRLKSSSVTPPVSLWRLRRHASASALVAFSKQIFRTSFSAFLAMFCSTCFFCVAAVVGSAEATFPLTFMYVSYKFSHVALASAFFAAAHAVAESMAAPMAPSLFNFSAVEVFISLASMPMDLAARSLIRLMHSSRVSSQSWLTCFAALFPASLKAIAISVFEGSTSPLWMLPALMYDFATSDLQSPAAVASEPASSLHASI